MKAISSVLLLMIFSFSELRAQDEALLRIVVISEADGSPLVAANVLIYEPGEDELLLNCVTNPTGFCEIRDIEAGRELELRISYVGFSGYSEILTFEQGERKTLRVELEEAVGDMGEELTVRGERVITTGEAGVRRVSTVDISRVPTPGVDGDLVSYLQTEPGVVTTGDRGGDLFIRGGTPDQNLVLVDNLPIAKPFHVSNLFSAFSDEVIQSADVYAGGYGSEFTNAMSAVIDINLRSGNFREYTGSGAVSPYMVSLQAEGPLVNDRHSFLLMGRKSTIEGLAPTIINNEVPINFADFVGRYTLQADNMTCNVTGIYTFDSGEVVPSQQLRSEWSNTVLGGRCLAYDPGLKYPIEITAGYSGFYNAERSNEVRERYSSLNQVYLNVNMREQLWDVPLIYGFGVNFRSYDVILNEKFTEIESVSRLIPIMNMFVSGNWEISDRFELQPGITTHFSVDHFGGLEPRLRFAWKPDGSSRQELSIAAGKYVQLFSGVGDQRDVGSVFTVLQPIKLADKVPESYHGIIGYQQKIGAAFVANVEGYAKTYKNIPVSKWSPAARIQLETANAKGLAYGFDVRLRYQQSNFFMSAGYGWSKITYEAITGDLGAWIVEPIFEYSPAHDQRHKLNILTSYTFGEFTANVRWELGSGKPYTQIFGYDFEVLVPAQDVTQIPGRARTLYSRPFGERLPYYHRLDVSLGRGFAISNQWLLEAETGVINTYDRNNVFNFDINTLQRVNQTPLFPYLSVKLSKN
ncbi:TonB-dependent receptor [Gracilimonas sp.]|uniref:TonB-dependent receptor n=1 Tax=Gracilimonas sp. TaxID=1974203 RepID=UPI003D0F6220